MRSRLDMYLLIIMLYFLFLIILECYNTDKIIVKNEVRILIVKYLNGVKVDILNNREWALVIWFLIFIFFTIFLPKMKKIRESFKRVLKTFFVKAIITILVLMVIYIIIVVFGLFKIGLWKSHQLKNTIVWAVSVGALSLFKINSIKKDPHFFKNIVLANLKLVAIVQFVVRVYTFSLLIEFLLVPVLVTLGAMLGRAQTNKKYNLLEKVLNGIMVTLGTIIIFYTTYMLATNFGKFAKEQTIYDFYIPPLLTFLYLPFIFIMMVFTTYSEVFVRLQFFIKELKLRRFAKIYSMFKFHFRIKLLERWASTLPFQDITSKEDIKKTVKQIFKMVSVEKEPPEVPLQEGWSPYAARQFLLTEGIETGYYHPSVPEEWFASSPPIDVGKDVIPNSITYYVDGNESTAKSLKLILNVYSRESAIMAHSKLLSSVRTLLKAALDLDVSSEMEAAIMKGENQVFNLGSFVATVEKNDWQQNHFGGYDVRFALSPI